LPCLNRLRYNENMAVIPIRKVPDPILREKAKRVKNIDSSIVKLAKDMIETLEAAAGAGLAGPQVGIPLRIVVISIPEKKPIVMINPQIMRRSGERIVEEGCLSIPGFIGEVKRSKTVTAKALDIKGKEFRVKGTDDILAQALEHEINHLNGVLYIDQLTSPDTFHKIEPRKFAPEEEPETESSD
jgi:peptide deformylase